MANLSSILTNEVRFSGISKFAVVRNLMLFALIGNIQLGYPFTNFVVGIVPINEVLLFLCLVLIVTEIPGIIKAYPVLILLLLWSVAYMFIAVPLGIMEHGIFAARDATHLMEVWWVVVLIYVCERVDFEEFIKKLLLILTVVLAVKMLTLSIPGIEAITIKGVQGEIPLLMNRSPAFIAVEILLASYMTGLYRNRFLLFLLPLSLIFFLKRALIVGIVSILALFVILMKMPPRLLVNIAGMFLGVILVLFVVSQMEFLDKYTTKGVKNLRPDRIAMYIYSATGEAASEDFEGAAAGTSQRLNWFNTNIDRAMASDKVFLAGQGFGMLLTDFKAKNPVREPHNSYLSVFARTGLIGFILWATFHLWLNVSSFRLLFLSRVEKLREDFMLRTLFTFFISMSGMYLFSLVECGFEVPSTCIPFYFIVGIMLFANQKIRHRLRQKAVNSISL